MKNPRDIIREPVVSEKSYDLVEDFNTYTFVVDRRSSKTEIKQAIQSIFGVKVVRVNTINRKGKKKRTGWVVGKRADTNYRPALRQDLIYAHMWYSLAAVQDVPLAAAERDALAVDMTEREIRESSEHVRDWQTTGCRF